MDRLSGVTIYRIANRKIIESLDYWWLWASCQGARLGWPTFLPEYTRDKNPDGG